MDNSNYLLLSLGHNSSAIFVANNGHIIGYEQERLSGIKADSQFPIDAINEIIKHVGLKTVSNSKVYISHWFNIIEDFDEPEPNKYYTIDNKQFLIDLCGKENIYYVNEGFTHHDAHAHSAYAFFDFYNKKLLTSPVYCLVADGFGNNGEVISLYKDKKLIHRVYGYKNSLGLMYQYATSFVGMKENQDEYKFLGYESHIKEALEHDNIVKLDDYVEKTVAYLLSSIDGNTEKYNVAKGYCIDFEALDDARDHWYSFFNECISIVGIHYKESYNSRCVIGYFVQSVCEKVLEKWLAYFDIDNLIVAGGIFYNVKLNRMLLTKVAKQNFSVIPLAGDQGAAIGLYTFMTEKQFDFSNLYWGKRSFYNLDKHIALLNKKFGGHIKHFVISSTDYYTLITDMIADLVANNNLVNIVMDNLEFGPRALGHTSTIFLPSTKNVDRNNSMNGRNEVMPCAPILTDDNAKLLFDSTTISKVVGSDKFMICTHTYKKPHTLFYGGIMHKDPIDNNVYTGRPQIVCKGEFMYDVLKKVQQLTDCKALVNTSFNVHGQPIVYNVKQILQNFEYQCEHVNADDHIPFLIIIENIL